MNGYSMTDEVYSQMEFETRPFTATCSWCGITDIAPERDLLAAGWMLTDKTEVCGKCVKRMAAYEQSSETKSEVATGVIEAVAGSNDNPMRTQVAGMHQFVLDPSPFKKEKRYSYAG